MSTVLNPSETKPLVLHFGSFFQKMTDDESFEFCQLNKDLRIERTLF